MKNIILVVSFLALNCPTAYSAYAGSRYPYRETRSGELDNQTDRGYKIVIKLDDAFGKVGHDLEQLGELQSDMKIVKALVENMAQDIREIRHLGPNSENLIANSSRTYNYGRGSSSQYPMSSTSEGRQYKPSSNQWGIALPKINCAELRLSGEHRSGVYSIQPDRSRNPFEVYCDMTTDGGGWTVIQRRGALNIPKSAREDFYRSWRDYENGFGSQRSDYWTGLENIQLLTQGCNNELIVNLTSWDNAWKFARYGQFNISDKADFYRLTVANYTGNAGDGLLQHNKMRFSTYDKQNDFNGDENCAQLYTGAWWYKDCFWSNLNGLYADDGSDGKMSERNGIEWASRHYYSYMKTEMKIRPKC